MVVLYLILLIKSFENIPMSTPSQSLFFYGVQGDRLAARPDGFGGPCANTTYSFGDTHGNAIGLVRYFYDSGIIQLTDEEFQTLIRIYEVDNNKDYRISRLTAEQLASFRTIIHEGFSKINLTGQVRYRCFGDLVGDRGSNDILSFIIFDELRHKYPIPKKGASTLLLTILQSNHDKSFLLNYLLGNLQPDKQLQLEIYPEQCCSLLRLKDLIDRGVVSYEEIERMIQTVYLPALKLVDYVRNEDGSIDVMSHAPLSLPAIDDVMRKLLPQSQHRNIYASVDNLVAVLDQLNDRYKPKPDARGRLVFDQVIKDAIIAPPVTGLLDRFMWPRLTELQADSPPPAANYAICFRHGHDGEPGVKTIIHGIRYVGYNNNLGKATLLAGSSVMTATVMRPSHGPISDQSAVILELERTLAATVAARDAALVAKQHETARAEAAQARIAELQHLFKEATAKHHVALTAERTATARAKAEAQAATGRIASAEVVARAATASTQATQSKIAGLEQELAVATNARGAAQTQITVLERELAVAQGVAQTATASASAAQTRIKALQQQLKEITAAHDAALAAERTATARARADTQAATGRIASAEAAARAATASTEAAEARVRELEQAVAVATKAHGAAQRKITGLEGDLAAAKFAAQTAAVSASAVQTRVAQLDRELAATKIAAQTATAERAAALTAGRTAIADATAAVQARIKELEQELAAARADVQTATASANAAQTKVTELERSIVLANTERDNAVAAARAATARAMPLPTSPKKERLGVFAKIVSLKPWKLGMYTGFAVTAIVGTGLVVYFIAPFAVPVIMTNVAMLKAAILKFALEHTFLLPILNTLTEVVSFSAQLLAPLVNLLANFVNLLANIVIPGSTTKMAIGVKCLALTAGSGLSAGLVTTAVAQAATQTIKFFSGSNHRCTQATTPAINSRMG